MKIGKYLIAFLILTFAVSSCLDDKGNYNYSESEIITVGNIKSSYSVISRGEQNLVIKPDVTASFEDAQLTYKWSVYERNAGGYVPKFIEIATTKDLDYEVELDTKNWVLAFEVTNEKTGYSVKNIMPLSVGTEYTKGWYVLKDDGVNSDLDMFQVGESYVVEDNAPKENLFMKVNERNLKGKALKLSYLTQYKSMSPSGLYVNTKTLLATSENDIFAASINDLTLLNDYSTIMFSPNPDPKPMGVIGTTMQYLLSNGKLHSISANSQNIGKFGFAKQFDEEGSDYQLSPYVSSFTNSSLIAFDNLSSSFVKGSYLPILTIQGEDATSELPIKNNNHTCLYMELYKKVYDPAIYRYDYYAYGVFEEKDTKERMIGYIFIHDSKFKVTKIPVKQTDKANVASLFTISKDEDILYFAAEGKVYSRDISISSEGNSGVEKIEFEVPAGEEIVLLRHLKKPLYSHTSEDEKPYCHNLIAVGTNCGGEYKVRMFEKVAGHFKPSTPLFEMKGKGNLGDVKFILPSLYEDDGNYY